MKKGFTLIELLIVMVILSAMGGIVTEFFIKNTTENRRLEARSSVQKDLTLAQDRIGRVVRGASQLVTLEPNQLVIRGIVNSSDLLASEVRYYLDGSALKYSVTPATGSAPNYTYLAADAVSYTLLFNTTNSLTDPLFTYYDDTEAELAAPVNPGSVKLIKIRLLGIDESSLLVTPIEHTVWLNLRNFKTNL